jgi:hypothetical protein
MEEKVGKLVEKKRKGLTNIRPLYVCASANLYGDNQIHSK